jgi:hypothetical protein
MLKKHPHARWIPSESTSAASATTSVDSTQPSKKQKGKLLSSIDSSKIDITYSDDVDSDLIPFFVSPVSEQPQPRRRNKVHALLDTGSLAGNFIAFRILQTLSLTHHIYNNSKKMCSVCSGLDNHCRDVSDTIDLILSYFRRDLDKYSSSQISAFVLQDTPVDLIIGRKTIQMWIRFLAPETGFERKAQPYKGRSATKRPYGTVGFQRRWNGPVEISHYLPKSD